MNVNKFTSMVIIMGAYTTGLMAAAAGGGGGGRESSTIDIGGAPLHRAHYAIIGSTQTKAIDLTDKLSTGDSSVTEEVFGTRTLSSHDFYVITAREQTAGIGQHGRVFASPPGNIFATFIIPFLEAKVALLPFVPQVMNLSVCQTMRDYGMAPQFKWINDTLLAGRKSAGVLCRGQGYLPFTAPDGHVDETRHMGLLVGIGVNVNMDLATATERYEAIADPMKVPFGSMHLVSGAAYDVDEVFLKLATHVRENIIKLQAEGFTPFAAEVNSLLAFKGEVVEYRADGADASELVTFVGINERGYAILRDADGAEREVFSGRIRPRAD
jgi:BirA family biotin operon repressor/biotin-[acetyl-CoA-carboxylase] ligase